MKSGLTRPTKIIGYSPFQSDLLKLCPKLNLLITFWAVYPALHPFWFHTNFLTSILLLLYIIFLFEWWMSFYSQLSPSPISSQLNLTFKISKSDQISIESYLWFIWKWITSSAPLSVHRFDSAVFPRLGDTLDFQFAVWSYRQPVPTNKIKFFPPGDKFRCQKVTSISHLTSSSIVQVWG